LITFIILSFVIYNIWDYLFPARSNPTMVSASLDFRPDAAFDATFLFMLSERKGGIPDYYMLLNYRPRDEVIILVPVRRNLSAEVGRERGTLTDHYVSNGARGAMLAIENALGVKTEHYIKFDRESFIGFFDTLGFTPVNIPYDLKDGEIEFPAGSYEMAGAELYGYITFPDYNQGEDYRSTIHGHVISNFINRNTRNLTVTQLQTLFNRILNNTDTNLVFADFTRNQQVFLFTTQNSFDIADFYVLSGFEGDDGMFVPSETSLFILRDRLGFIRGD
jgi:anionic cell wall polymer biosynthesis LytR-Cps2A-Psr (LCP) family protein